MKQVTKTDETKGANPKLAPFRKNADSNRSSRPDSLKIGFVSQNDAIQVFPLQTLQSLRSLRKRLSPNWLCFAKRGKPKVYLCNLSADSALDVPEIGSVMQNGRSRVSCPNYARNAFPQSWICFAKSGKPMDFLCDLSADSALHVPEIGSVWQNGRSREFSCANSTRNALPRNWLRFAKRRKPKVFLCDLSADSAVDVQEIGSVSQSARSREFSCANSARNAFPRNWLRFAKRHELKLFLSVCSALPTVLALFCDTNALLAHGMVKFKVS
jgi:hypothetical protein